jgi:hypothetical protein
MTPASFFTGGTAGKQWAEREIEKPRPSPAGPQKIHARDLQRTRNLFGSPAQGGLANKGAPDHGCAIETAHDDPLKNSGCFRIDQRRIEHKQTEQLLSVCHFTIAEVPRRKPSIAL